MSLNSPIDLGTVIDVAKNNDLLGSATATVKEIATELCTPGGNWRNAFKDGSALDEFCADVGEAIGAGNGAAKGDRLAGAIGKQIGAVVGGMSGRDDGGNIIT